MRVHRLLLLLATAFALSAPAAAHGSETHGFEVTKTAGEHYVTLRISEEVVMAEREMTAYVDVFNPESPSASGVEGVAVSLTSPDGEVTDAATRTDQYGFLAQLTFPVEGAWKANVTIMPQNESAEFPIPVYANNPYVWALAPDSDGNADVYFAGHESTIRVVVNQWGSGTPAPAPGDATARIEHWSDDHSTKFSEFVVPMEPKAAGRYEFKTTLAEKGMYHVLIASPTLELDYEDRPYQHAYAIDVADAEIYGLTAPKAETPGIGALAVAFAAVAAAGLAARRRR